VDDRDLERQGVPRLNDGTSPGPLIAAHAACYRSCEAHVNPC
jgi:hypothetical protein